MENFIPSILKSAINKFRKQKPFPIISSYQEALKLCSSQGYQNPDLVNTIIEKNLIFKNNLNSNTTFKLDSLRTIIGMGSTNSNENLKVLDFGGGGGYHYQIAKTYYGNTKNIYWNVVETSKLAQEAQTRLSDDKLKFFNNINEAAENLKEIDLVFTSSALQYTPEPLDFLKKLIAIKAKHLYITRTPFNDLNEPLISIQSSLLSNNGPGALPSNINDCLIQYPIHLAEKEKIEKLISSQYNIRFYFEEEKNIFNINNKMIHMYGYFCDLKT